MSVPALLDGGLSFKNAEDATQNLEVVECRQIIHIETTKGLYQREGLIQEEKATAGRHIVDKPFLFGKFIMFACHYLPNSL